MTPEQAKVLRELSEEGYAVVIFTPEELDLAPAIKVESAMIPKGWETIEYYLKDSTLI